MEPATLDTNIWFTTEELEMVSHLGRAAMKKYYYIYLFIIVHESRAELCSALRNDDLFTISIDFDHFRSISITSDPKFKLGSRSDLRS